MEQKAFTVVYTRGGQEMFRTTVVAPTIFVAYGKVKSNWRKIESQPIVFRNARYRTKDDILGEHLVSTMQITSLMGNVNETGITIMPQTPDNAPAERNADDSSLRSVS